MSEKGCMAQAPKILPDGWRMVKFGDVVCNVNISEHNPMEKGLERFVGLDHIDPGSLQIKRWGMIEDGITFTRKFVKGQLLFGKRRSYQEKLAVADFDGICSGDILVFESKDGKLIPELLPFIVQNDFFFDLAIGTSSGSLSPRTKWKHLAAYEFPLPPIDEQHRIADIIWAAEDCIVKKDKLIEETYLYKNILMKELLKKGIGHKEIKNTEIGKIPEKLDFLNLSDIFYLEYGDGLPEKQRDGGDYPVYGSNGIIGSHSKYLVKGPGIIVGRKGTIGAITWSDPNFWPIDTTYYIKLRKEDLNLKWLFYKLESLNLEKLNMATGTPGLNRDSVYKLKIPYPPPSEQCQIAEILSKVDDTINKIQENINKTKELKKMLINQFLNDGLETAVSIKSQAKQLYKKLVSE